MASFHFDLVSPEKLAFSGDVDQVDIPGIEGDFGVLAGHAPVVAAVRPGILTVTTGSAKQKIIVLGGLAEVSDKGLTVLADVATSLEELDRTEFADTVADMQAKLSEKEGSNSTMRSSGSTISRASRTRSVRRRCTKGGERSVLIHETQEPRFRHIPRALCSSGERREVLSHRPIHVAAEGHDEIGDKVEPLPSPSIELRRLAVARGQRIDFLVGTGETQCEPFLPLAAEFREPVG